MKRSIVMMLFVMTTASASINAGPRSLIPNNGTIASATAKICVKHGTIEAIAACVDMVSAIGGLGYVAGKADALCSTTRQKCEPAVINSEDMKLLREWANPK